MGIQFRVLGQVEAYLDGRPIAVGYRQLHTALAVLLVEANRPVSVDEMIDRVWGTRRLPDRPRRAVQHGIALLRRALAPATEVAIVRQSTAYRLAVDTDLVDVHRFHALLADAATVEPDELAAALFERALGLWRGEPFAGLDTPWLESQRGTLLAQHQSAQLELTDILLRLGRHTPLLADLAHRVALLPLNERLAGQYLLALYRDGRQADALAHYHTLRRRLADELGADPSPPLQQLYHRILAADPALAMSAPSVATRLHRPVPRQLPARPQRFVGRADALARLTSAVDEHDTSRVLTISGMGGIGKTWLALRWAHEHPHRFPDGQLHVNLRGFDPTGAPLSAATVIRGFLDALGIDHQAAPADLHARIGLYRSVVADKRMLVVLDNAVDADQVVPLLPGSPNCTVLITSRCRLAELTVAHGAHALHLDPLSEEESRELLADRVGHDRIAAEPDAVRNLVAGCAGLPLAVGVVAGRLAGQPGFPLPALTAELLDAARAAVFRVLSWSVDALSPAAALVFGLLATVPGPDIARAAVVRLFGDPGRTDAVLRELVDASLLRQHAPGRYRMHDLIRRYAAARPATTGVATVV